MVVNRTFVASVNSEVVRIQYCTMSIALARAAVMRITDRSELAPPQDAGSAVPLERVQVPDEVGQFPYVPRSTPKPGEARPSTATPGDPAQLARRSGPRLDTAIDRGILKT